MVLSGIVLYVKGETDTKLLGKCNKNWKLTLGIPIGILGCLVHWSWIPILCVLTYLIAGEMPYGDNHWWTKLWGKRKAITICGAFLGAASFPLTHYWAILGALISGLGFYFIAVYDDKGKIKEPFVAILRGIVGTIMLLFI